MRSNSLDIPIDSINEITFLFLAFVVGILLIQLLPLGKTIQQVLSRILFVGAGGNPFFSQKRLHLFAKFKYNTLMKFKSLLIKRQVYKFINQKLGIIVFLIIFIVINFVIQIFVNLLQLMGLKSNSINFQSIILLVLINIAHASNSCNFISNLSQKEVWQYFSFSTFEIYFTYTVGSLALGILALSLITWIYNPNFIMPLDIIFIVIVGSLLDIVSHLIQVIYYNANQDQPANFGKVCSGLGFFNMLGNVISLYYNAFFCAALAYSINNTLRKPFLDGLKMHLLCLLAVISAVFIIVFTQNSGYPLSGLCIYRLANQSSLGLFFLHTFLLSISIYSMRKFRSKIPKNTYFQKKSHFKYYHNYMIIFAVSQGFYTILYLIGNISCQVKSQNLHDLLDNLYTITNVITIVMGFATAILRIGHPRYVNKFMNTVGIQGNSQQRIQQQQYQWIDSLIQSIKGSQILSFIESIMMSYIEHSNKYPLKLTPYHFQREYSFILNQTIAQDYVRRRITNRDSHFHRQNSAGLKTLSYEVIIYTPEFFSWLFRSEKVNLFKSFDIRKNLSLVKEQSYTQGGKSGQFFFGTYDHQFIFKTIQPGQAEVYIEKAQQFYEYYIKNPDNLLIKILGLYKFTRKDIEDQSVFLILMKNLTSNPKDVNLRVYDIKGSEFNRSTLSDKNISINDQEKLRKYTLKDKDFLQIEGKIKINQEQATQLKAILARDIEFLGKLGVMDYSLLIIKREGQATNLPGEFQSTQDPSIYFNFGIIDYLEQWTLRRKAERVFKTLITSEQVTANSPLNYSKRLIQFINMIL